MEALVAYELNREGARLVRERRKNGASHRRGWQARASSPAPLGPTNRTASISPDVSTIAAFRAVTFDDQLKSAYGVQAERPASIVASMCILIETIFDTLNAKAALYAISRNLRGARRRHAQ